MDRPLVSVIIPLKAFNSYIREAISYYEKLDYPSFEIILLPDSEESEVLSEKLSLRVVPSGPVGPAEKRDMGAKLAKGTILAFTDDDAYPDPLWLKNAVALLLSSEDIGAVGGPGITPLHDSFWQRVSGNVYASLWMSGGYRKRYLPVGKTHEDYDIPSVNLIVRREVFEKVGGFDSTYYPGEDTKLCLAIKNLGYRILYSPEIRVWHHRRSLWPTHFKQIANYALHRGFFVKHYPETSLKLTYILPSLFLIGVTTGWVFGLFLPVVWKLYWGVLGVYFGGALFFSTGSYVERPFTVLAIFFSHLTYGWFFLQGLFTKELKR
ncbi:glycosyltransferase [Thermospira aquatica]|uniref:Glycosyltransferase n=1 Tax=Thermospira aquatica TaxID=2828656 RepID=A0AAX3BBT3_9SPIR|nr:glycosyltransferase [Thermospira aquatica]URA09695.1 glycosyltransferase [Thermospira aquatica]